MRRPRWCGWLAAALVVSGSTPIYAAVDVQSSSGTTFRSKTTNTPVPSQIGQWVDAGDRVVLVTGGAQTPRGETRFSGTWNSPQASSSTRVDGSWDVVVQNQGAKPVVLVAKIRAGTGEEWTRWVRHRQAFNSGTSRASLFFSYIPVVSSREPIRYQWRVRGSIPAMASLDATFDLGIED